MILLKIFCPSISKKEMEKSSLEIKTKLHFYKPKKRKLIYIDSG